MSDYTGNYNIIWFEYFIKCEYLKLKIKVLLQRIIINGNTITSLKHTKKLTQGKLFLRLIQEVQS